MMDLIKQEDTEMVLAICESGTKPQIEESLKNITKKKILTLDDLSGLEENVNDTVLLEVPDEKLTDTVLQKIFSSCKPGSRLIVNKVTDLENAEFLLKTSGFTDVQTKEKTLIAIKPKYEIGSSAKLNLRKPAVWKIDGDEEENIDPDELLDEDDLKKPDPNSLRVCGTTGKRKACKDCSCGLAEELAGEAKTGQVIDTTNAPKSSCGNCYLGDAFRCASCPYLGMPAFKPGEKIQLTENLLKADV